MVKFADELRGINEQAALSFDRRKNPAEYESQCWEGQVSKMAPRSNTMWPWPASVK